MDEAPDAAAQEPDRRAQGLALCGSSLAGAAPPIDPAHVRVVQTFRLSSGQVLDSDQPRCARWNPVGDGRFLAEGGL